jgi:hypothetical protein
MSLAVQLQDTGNVVALCGVPLVLGELVLYARGRANPSMEAAGFALFSAGDTLTGIGSLMRAQWGGAAWNFALGAFFAWLAWRRWRKHRKRIAALLGAKSRALRDVLVRKAKEAAKPRPVLRPVPGGAR